MLGNGRKITFSKTTTTPDPYIVVEISGLGFHSCAYMPYAKWEEVMARFPKNAAR